MHVEQLFAPFYNICYEGSTTWWVVHRDDRQKLDEYLTRRAMQWYGVPDDVQLTDAEYAAIKGLLYTKAVVFHPDDVVAARVRLTRVVQGAGNVVVGDGDLVHFGVVTPNTERPKQSRSVNEAINFLPLRWLTTGLPRLVTWLRWLRDAWLPSQRPKAMADGGAARLRTAMWDKQTNVLVAQHCASRWSSPFLRQLRTLMAKPTEEGDAHHATRMAIFALLTEAEVDDVRRDLKDALDVMRKPGVKGWLERYWGKPH